MKFWNWGILEQFGTTWKVSKKFKITPPYWAGQALTLGWSALLYTLYKLTHRDSRFSFFYMLSYYFLNSLPQIVLESLLLLLYTYGWVCTTAAAQLNLVETLPKCSLHHTLLEKQSKIPRYNMKSKGKPDTTVH